MYYLFEESDTLNTPIECFVFDAACESFPVKPHWHYFMEIIYMLNGSAEIYVDGKRMLLDEGNMILFYPQSVHSIYAVDSRLPQYSVIKLDINRLNMTPNYAPKLRSIFKSAQKKGMNIFFSTEQSAELNASRTFEICINETKTQKYGFDLQIKSELYRLFLGIIRIWIDNGFSVDSEAFTEDNRFDIFNITEYIDSNMSSDVKVSDIANKCGMSYSHFAKRFLAVYGKTCKEYIEQMRVYKVEEFLSFTDFDLNYISQETGFSDCSHMIKSFKRFNGITPKQFRLKHNSVT